MTSFFAELKRRNVFRVAIAYIVVGWVVMQVAEFLAPLLRLPEWTVSLSLYVGILGFPFAILFAWAYELTPDGLKRSQDVNPSDSITEKTGAWLNRLVIFLMALVIVGLLADRYLQSTPLQKAGVDAAGPVAEEGPVAPKTSAEEVDLPRSIAVLPFVNMSNDPEQEYFSDGISEELLNSLAKIRELRVAARTSSFAFKGKNQDITDIGNQLKVDTVLEGSVRKSGQRLRITAQLINVDDGYHLWTETYDRDITDIFVIQDEISAAIVKALRVHLTTGEASIEKKTVDIGAYNFYLLARHNLRRRTEESLALAVLQYQQAIDIDASYAAAWAEKALATYLLSDNNYGAMPKDQAIAKAQMFLDMAFALDANLGIAHATQSLLLAEAGRSADALVSLEKAIAENPSEGILFAWQSNVLGNLGQSRQAFDSIRKAYEVDPLHPVIRVNLSRFLVDDGQISTARELFAPGTPDAYQIEGLIAAQEGRHADMAVFLKQALDAWQGENAPFLSKLFLSETYLHWLKNFDLAEKVAPQSIKLAHLSLLDPERAWELLSTIEETDPGGEHTPSLVIAAIQLDKCSEAVQILSERGLAGRPPSGGMSFLGSDAWLYFQQAYCHNRLGNSSEAGRMAGELEKYIEFAITNQEPPNYFRLLAAVQLLQGRDDEALQSLTSAARHYQLSWLDASMPWFQSLRGREEFIKLRKTIEIHLNAEREKMGWDPVEF